MAYTSEIDKLEARFRDNPKGRNFAPLADAYRKAGLIDNAIDLCQNGLQLHPDYVSAHIVYARCLIDKKDDNAAQGVFTKVLELDRENIIALRGLAELADRNGRYDEEVVWLSRLLNADPMNGDAAEALARAKGKAATSVAAPSVAGAPPEAATTPMTKPDFAVDHETPEPIELTKSAGPSTSAPEVENFENPISFNANAHAAARAEGLEVQEDVELNAEQIEQVEIEGLARTQYEGSGMFKFDGPEAAAAPSGAELDDALPQVDLPLIMPDDETRAPAPRPPKPPAPPPAPPPPPPGPTSRVPAAVALSDDDGAADTATLSQAEPVLTETMAELYLKQGHQQDALRVYQALLAQRPHDARLKNKVEQLSSGGRKKSRVSAQAFLKGIWSGRGSTPAAPAPRSTLAAAFDVAGPTLGEPSRPAQDHISLDSVFGEEAGRRAHTEPTESPASSTPPPEGTASPAGGGGGSKTGGFSFDEFFAGGKPGAAGGGGAAAAEASSPKTPSAGRSSGRTQRSPEDEAEADQFQQWLKKLKS